ncbi:MAG: hypothetical protein KAI63_02825 [Planctomycetes bacterium]|nr:hypothetical protein [Planctomycetota bacterium]
MLKIPLLKSYFLHQETQYRQHESLCKRCGTCCGSADDDPCKHLKSFKTIDNQVKYYCATYQDRFRTHQTKKGTSIQCVPIRAKRFETWPGSESCGYRQS